MRILLAIFTSVLIFNFGCQKEGPVGPAGQNGKMDKQIRFDLVGIHNGLSDTTIWTIKNSGCGIDQFNIGNYPEIDSVVFVAYDIITASGCCGDPDIQKTTRIELYDLTNKSVINNSQIISDDTPSGKFIASKNILNNFPKQTIDLGVRIIFDKNYWSSTGRMHLFLYRK